MDFLHCIVISCSVSKQLVLTSFMTTITDISARTFSVITCRLLPLLLSELLKPLLGRTRSRGRCWAAIPLSRYPKPSGHEFHGEVDGLDIEGQHGRRFVLLCHTHRPQRIPYPICTSRSGNVRHRCGGGWAGPTLFMEGWFQEGQCWRQGRKYGVPWCSPTTPRSIGDPSQRCTSVAVRLTDKLCGAYKSEIITEHKSGMDSYRSLRFALEQDQHQESKI